MTSIELLFRSVFSSCTSIFAMLFGFGICWSAFIKWGRARQDHSLSVKVIHYAEAWARVLLSFCILGAALVALVVTDSDGDIPTANTILSAFFIPAIVFALVSGVLMVVRYIFIARNSQAEGRQQDG